jgi:hypothetical protein
MSANAWRARRKRRWLNAVQHQMDRSLRRLRNLWRKIAFAPG